MIIFKIVKISQDKEKIKNLTEKVKNRREKGDINPFKDILQREINKGLSEEKFDDSCTIEEMF
ncbi:hypothetical protein [Clostridium butyricum]|uniref:Uncharacterized protein n=1 Tax=Clostridium butyricum E4 str. BoNT E BL5262 TaxID=632245 RepID=C4IK91_CLOBU|nr:hypothetical protein [Clostridium butyricum]EDT75109.1 hypothetical protein CBY_3264 [Clostridium butyricum 5521]EEP54775.1 conserved hypothetical protein [Clostridium butyricum E4 str. BoNT E BL5262]NFL33424.1 hypothetical protein [Clostridium butyricum]NFS20498.1 hypothetical protein [Clostridium butyricum]